MTFRKKIIFSQLLLFVLFISALFPLIEKTVGELVRESLEESTTDLIDLIEDARNEEELIEYLKNQEFFVFFRISLLNEKNEMIYDSHLGRLFKEELPPFRIEDHPEVQQARKGEVGYVIEQSKTFAGKFAYVAIKFDFQGRSYILRTAFPFNQIQDLTKNFEIGFLIFSFATLLFFMALTWLIFHRFSRPIRKIIDAIRPYQTGQREDIPEITLDKSANKNDEFNRLAITLNSLSEKVRTQIKSITEERNEKEAILESLGEGVVAVDPHLKVTYINYIGCKMLGLSKKTVLNETFPASSDRAPPILVKKCHDLLQKCQKQAIVLTDFVIFGHEKKSYIDLIAVPKGHSSGAIIVLQDKSSHYKVLEMGKDFIANASHELKTPITIIKGFAETLHDMPEMSKQMLTDITAKILRNCERMETLVKNLLTLADLENIPESRFKECDLALIVEACKHVLLSLNPETKIKISKSDEELRLYADPDILELAILNLLNNAVKYSKPPAKITISMRSLNEEEIELKISDQGIGIEEQDLEHIFERFYTVDKARSRRLGGAGLGLSIVKTIIDKHDGSISAESTIGTGTTFTIILPKKRHILKS
ncbi:MAG TPA: ATP-binding protein [Rhabdochlamydiaceae bacterium]|nr:ATP-binding protein [Rhabdochlamydiaceae bacterium]